MKIYRGFHDPSLKPCARVAAIGVFDGVHLGHQLILKQALALSRKTGQRSLVITFDPHPVSILRDAAEHPPFIMSLAHRLRFFERLGFREVLVVRFNRHFSRLTRGHFVERLLLGRLGISSIVVGSNFRFGCHASGNAGYLKKLSAKKGFSLKLVNPLRIHRRVVSSTRIRHCIEKGDLGQAARLLGRPVSVYGTVVGGTGRGHALGYPTANIDPHHEALPPDGVYAAAGLFHDRPLCGILHVGYDATFRARKKTLEVYFFDFHRSIYGEELEVFFITKLRNTRKFAKALDLKRAIDRDAAKARVVLSNIKFKIRRLYQ